MNWTNCKTLNKCETLQRCCGNPKCIEDITAYGEIVVPQIPLHIRLWSVASILQDDRMFTWPIVSREVSRDLEMATASQDLPNEIWPKSQEQMGYS